MKSNIPTDRIEYTLITGETATFDLFDAQGQLMKTIFSNKLRVWGK